MCNIWIRDLLFSQFLLKNKFDFLYKSENSFQRFHRGKYILLLLLLKLITVYYNIYILHFRNPNTLYRVSPALCSIPFHFTLALGETLLVICLSLLLLPRFLSLISFTHFYTVMYFSTSSSSSVL